MKKNIARFLSALLAAVMLMSVCASGDGWKGNEKTNSYNFGDCEVVYKSACIMPDSMGEDALVIYFDFTNNSGSATSYGWTAFEKLTQGDAELETTFVIIDLDTYDYIGEGAFSDIAPGTTVEVSRAYKLNGTDIVNMNLSDLFDLYVYDLTFDPTTLERVEPKPATDEDDDASNASLSHISTPANEGSQNEPFLNWWSGDWYGWWIIQSGTGAYEEYEGYWWDACANVTIGEPTDDDSYNATVTMWDGSGSRFGDFIGEIDATISPYGVGEHGTLFSESGYFMDDELEHADWIVDPALTEFEDLMSIDGEYEGEEGSYTYMIILRPWGVMWDDMTEDSLPFAYDYWYLPWVNSGASMPDRLSHGYDGSSDATEPDQTEPAPTEPAPTEPAPTEPAPTVEAAFTSTGELIPFTVEGHTSGDKTPFTFEFSLPEGTWDLETYKSSVFPYNFKLYNWPDGNDAPFSTPFIWIYFHDNEQKLNFYVADYANLSVTEGRTIGGIEMQGRKYDYIGYTQMQEYYGVMPNGIGVSIRFVKMPDDLLSECYAILDTFSFD